MKTETPEVCIRTTTKAIKKKEDKKKNKERAVRWIKNS